MPNLVSVVGGTASTTGGVSVTTASYTPVKGDLLVLLVGAAGFVREPPHCVITNSVANLPGWVPVCRARFAASANSLMCFVGAELQGYRTICPARTTTINFAGVTTTGTFFHVFAIRNFIKRSGLGAVRQFAIQENGTAAATPAPVFPASCLTGNPILAFAGNGANPAALTPPTGWTEQTDTGFATPTTGFETARRDFGFTGTTVTWGGASATAFGAMAIEFNIADLTAGDVPQIEAGWGGIQ